MIIKLNVPERIHVLNSFPQEGSFVTLKAIRDLTAKVGFTADEIVEMQIVEDNGIVTWNESGKIEKDFNFNDAEAEIIRKELRKKDAEGTLNMGIYSVYEKFMC